LSTSTAPQAVGAYGGTVTVYAQVKDAYSCQLQLLSQQSFTVDFASNIRPCGRPFSATNYFTANVVIGPNTTMARRTVVFKLVVWYGPHRYAHGMVYIGVAPARARATGVTTTTTPYATTPPTPPPSKGKQSPSPVTTATTVPTSGDNPSTRVVESDNWAGYGVEGMAPYTGVSGTFNVPKLTADDISTDIMDVWVGIDGIKGTPGANDLIQAGVMESMVPCQGSMTTDDQSSYTGHQFWMCPWAFDIEDGDVTPIPVPGLTISAGDSVNVSIHQNDAVWMIDISDETTGQYWEGYTEYGGPGSSAEWIVEDPGDTSIACGQSSPNGRGQCAMAAYSPAVKFSNLGISPVPAPETKNWGEFILHNFTSYMSPSLVTTTANDMRFSVAYGGPWT